MLRLELIFTSSSQILKLILFYKDLRTHASHVKRDWTGCNLAFKKWGSALVCVYLPRARKNRADNKSMFVARSIAADHKDLIHDVSYDFHGRRMATCSSDQSIKVKDFSHHGLLKLVYNVTDVVNKHAM